MKHERFYLMAIAAAAALLFAACPTPVTSDDSNDKSNDANLSAMSVANAEGGAVALSPNFAALTTAYEVNVPTATVTVTISATAAHSGATVTGAGSLTLGAAGTKTTGTIVVTAEDGTTQKTYTVGVNRASADASTEARLSALTLKTSSTTWTLSPEFAADTHNYTLSVGNMVSYVDVTATAVDSNAVISGTGSKALNVGSNTVTVTATAEDGATTQTYTVTVTRAAPDSTLLGSLSTSAGILSPAFDPDSSMYTITLPSGSSSTTVSATRQFAGPDLEFSIDGGDFAPFIGSFVVSDVVEGTPQNAIIRVRYRDNTAVFEDYSITINRAAATASSVATLSDLTLNSGDITLSSVFSPDTHVYSAEVPASINWVELNFTTTDPGAVSSLSNMEEIDLVPGPNVIALTVTAADGVTQLTYTITVTRRAAPSLTIVDPVEGSSHSVGDITVSGTFIDPDADIARIIIGWGSQNVDCSLGVGTFTGTLDLSGAPNGPQSILVSAIDADNHLLMMVSRGFVITGSEVEAYSVSGSINLIGGLSDPAYLLLYLTPEEDEIGDPLGATTYYSTFIPVTNGDFPYDYSIGGVEPGTYEVSAVLFSQPVFDGAYVYGSGGHGIDVTTANVTGTDLTVVSGL